MGKSKNEEVFTTIRVLKKSIEKLQELNNQEVSKNQESIPQWKTFENLVSEKHKKFKHTKSGGFENNSL